MIIAISAEQLKVIYNHAESVYPEECCGILLGEIAGTSKMVAEIILTINAYFDLLDLTQIFPKH